MTSSHRVWFSVAELLGLLVLWRLLVSPLDLAEVIIGTVAAALSAFVVTLVRGENLARFLPPARVILRAWHLPGLVLSDTVRVFAVLLSSVGPGMPGRITSVAFHPGGDDPRSAARRALAVAELNMAPNSIVIDVDRARGVLIVHELAPSDMDGTLETLGFK